jgi:hypothetical protein
MAESRKHIAVSGVLPPMTDLAEGPGGQYPDVGQRGGPLREPIDGHCSGSWSPPHRRVARPRRPGYRLRGNAPHLALNIPVAIKVLPFSAAREKATEIRFKR